jgi:hypothetical protein
MISINDWFILTETGGGSSFCERKSLIPEPPFSSMLHSWSAAASDSRAEE